MKHTTSNIAHVNELAKNGITYCYFVKYVDGVYGEGVEFCHYDDAGRTTTDEVKPEDLPKHVQAFLKTHEPFLTYIDEQPNGDTFTHYRYK